MGKTIYKLFIGKMTEAWHQLTPEEQESYMTRVDGTLDQVGGRRTLICDSGWSSEQWPFFGVEEFPDIEAVQKHSDLLDEFNWGRYVESITLLGTM
jgi:hypothetical protein